MHLPIIENVWTKNSLTLQNEDGTVIQLQKHEDYVVGEIDKSHTSENKYKKWNTFGGFNTGTPYTDRLRRELSLKDAIWEFHFAWIGKEAEKLGNLNIEQKLDYPSMAQYNLPLFLEKMELPLPKEIQDAEKLFLIEGGQIFIKANPTDGDYLSVGLSSMEDRDLHKFAQELVRRATLEIENAKQRLTIYCPTQNEDGEPNLGDFINWYKELVFKAYTKWDFRYLYEPFVRTGKFECPFSGRTPEVQEIFVTLR